MTAEKGLQVENLQLTQYLTKSINKASCTNPFYNIHRRYWTSFLLCRRIQESFH